jgi:GAF domain-containing protein/HAMP domain-containing protein
MWNSLRFRLASILLGLAIGPLILAGAILSQRVLASEQKQALAFQSQVSKNAAAEVDGLFNNVVNNLTTLGSEITSLREPDRAQQLSLLLNALSSEKNQDAFDSLTLLDDQGNEILRLSRQEIVPRDQLVSHKTSEDYLFPKDSRESYFSAINFDKKSGQMYITIAIPLYQPRSVQLSNVLIARVRFGIVSSVLSNPTIGEGQTIYITDTTGHILAHKDRSVNLQNMVISLPAATSIQAGLDGVNSVIAYNEAKLGSQVIRVVAEKPTATALALANTTIATLGTLILATLIIAIILGFIAIQQIVLPIENLAVIAQKVASGDLSQKVSAHRKDEIGTLASTFNSMTARLGDLIDSLENRVKERTLDLEKANTLSEHRARQFETITRISRTVNSAQNLSELLPRISEEVSEQFGFYHVGIFLNDASNKYATLVAANSPGGKKMLARNHQLVVGEQGIVGYVTGSGDPRIALDVGIDSAYFNNPDLPETHSEMALPLKTGGSVIGALDVQSTERNAFTKDDVEVLSTLADQISLAIQNARLFDQTQNALAESKALDRQNSRDTWSRLPEKLKLKGYRYTASGSAPLFESGNAGDQNTQSNSQRQEMLVPIILRGETIGTLSVQIPRSERISSDQVDLIKAVAERVALSAENARLFEETSMRATRERLVSDITTRIRSTNDPHEMIQTAVEELKRVLGATRIEIVPQKIGHPPDK